MLDILDEHYNLDEFRELCFNLGVDYDNLGGEGKRAKARELLLLIYRQDRMAELLTHVADDRPNVTLPDLPTLRKQAKTWRKVSTRAERIRHTLIQNVRSVWVEGVLHHANDILLSLDLTYTPDALQRDVPILVQDDEGETAVDSSLLEVFEENGRRLLILGEPGSGKTFTLLQLTEDLLDQAEDNLIHPVPVIFNLSSWAKERKPLHEWLVAEMLTQYQLARKVTRTWLDRDEFLLLLDGLDEVAEIHRDDCLIAINEFMASHQSEVVVCSRTADYEHLKKRLNVTTAVRIQPLTDTEISHYLEQPGLELQAVRATLQTDEGLQELTKSPLTLTVMTLAYRGLSVEDLQPLDSEEVRREYLFEKYVEQMFKHRPTDEKDKVRKWLINLAKGMKQENQSIFYIEQLQPTWLHSIRWYLTLIGLLLGLSLGLLIGLNIGLPFRSNMGLNIGFPYGLLTVLSYGLILGLSIGLSGLLGSFVKNKWFRLTITVVSSMLISALLGTLINGLILGPISWLLNGQSAELLAGLTTGLVLGPLFGMFGGLLNGLITFNQQIYTIEVLRLSIPPRRDWLMKFRKGVFIGFNLGLIFVLIMTPVIMFVDELDSLFVWLFMELFIGLTGGLIGGLIGVTFAFIQPHKIERKSHPNQGMQASVKNALMMTVIISLFMGSIGVLLGWLVHSDESQISNALWISVPVSFFYYGGTTLIKHIALRFLLAYNSILPIRLISFLDAMAERIILRKVGGGYIFIHRYLLEYFAGLEDNTTNE